ncbi:MAG: hypothetical protein EKK63_13830 [Acinetobacter sp.]|uniref:hypothetical protein n=1 Tax=Acinetobacter sp. TaxID=472 RepID=UPI000F9B0666|nr:hypothetical protein [Acinetobacter sp.]RUP37981.1 MAG: hypothetical protein EKK63_13830 [Acinetobacter sp.]
MYTRAEAQEKIKSPNFQIEEFIDKELKERFRGEEISINLVTFPSDAFYYAEELYRKQGWSVRHPNMNPDNLQILYFK